MPSLRTLSIKENPFCAESDDWEGFVVAMLQVNQSWQPFHVGHLSEQVFQNLSYLECHRVDPVRREEAAVRYQGDIFRIRNDEDQVKWPDNPDLQISSSDETLPSKGCYD